MTTSFAERDPVLARLIAAVHEQAYCAWTEPGGDRTGRGDSMLRSDGTGGGARSCGWSSLAGSGRQVGTFHLR